MSHTDVSYENHWVPVGRNAAHTHTCRMANRHGRMDSIMSYRNVSKPNDFRTIYIIKFHRLTMDLYLPRMQFYVCVYVCLKSTLCKSFGLIDRTIVALIFFPRFTFCVSFGRIDGVICHPALRIHSENINIIDWLNVCIGSESVYTYM